ncbi:hypothetical protein TWF730_003558 [Orbilia blumenaviensis]|uniref:Uncharacterized protein n=1 Tax=Orbilia blumenaviensis TaxID=1796055 RepID=A0AAV9U416_9PEZI
MSSRALRRAQQRAEEERLASNNKQDNEKEDDDEEEEEEEETVVVSKKPNLFAMLEAEVEEAEDQDQNEEEEEEEETTSTSISTSTPSTSKSKSKKSKKKKKKNKGKGKTDSTKEDNDDKEFDSALQALKSTTLSATGSTSSTPPPQSSSSSLLNSLLTIDPRHLDLENEMRKLFGRSATASSQSQNPQQQQQQDPRAPRTRLPGATTRRNPFVQPGDNWPRDSSGGLSMDLLSKSPTDGTISFKYTHSRIYQSTQRQFLLCVRSMDPDRMISHLSTNPYHISTLLQTSHILQTQSNDHTTSQLLLSRALFSLGRSSHSVFPTSLTQGTARLPFIHFENRELYFSAWKYIHTLSRRGLWRTGLEFIKLLLQLSPLEDPLCLSLLIDQYALKSRSFQTLPSLSSTPLLSQRWLKSPNILYSLPLSTHMSGTNPELAKQQLTEAIITYPWLVTKLHGALSDSTTASTPLPTELWGLQPPSSIDSLLAEMYILRMSDLWNIPENAQFLATTLSTLSSSSSSKTFTSEETSKPKSNTTDTLYPANSPELRNLSRHIFLMDPADARGLIGFLTPEIRNEQLYSWDILPPVGGESSYQKEEEAENAANTASGGGGGGEALEAVGARGLFEAFFRSLMPGFQAPPPNNNNNNPTQQAQQPGAPAAQGVGQQQQQQQGMFEVGEDDLRATLVVMVEDGDGFPPGLSITQRAEVALNVGLVPRELRTWFGERFGITVIPEEEDDDDEEGPVGTAAAEEPVVEEEEEEEEVVQERDSRAIDRLVQILGTGDPASLRIRVDRMFEGQGAEMADVRRRVEERLGLR